MLSHLGDSSKTISGAPSPDHRLSGGGGKPAGVVSQGRPDRVHDKLGPAAEITGVDESLNLTVNFRIQTNGGGRFGHTS